MSAIINPIEQYFDLDGSPLQDGYLYFGVPFGNPITQPTMVYFDAEFTIPAPQPIRTINGYPVRAGTATGLYAPDSVSCIVQNKNKEQVSYSQTSQINDTQTTTEYRTSDSKFLLEDNNKTFIFLNSFTQTFDACAVLGNRWSITVLNMSSGIVTLEPNLSETIDGFTNLPIAPNLGATIYCNGISLKTNYFTTSISTKNKLINAQGLINQRAYVSGTATSGANQYTLDRWRVVVSGQNLTFSTAQNVTTFTAPAGGVEQVVEGLNLETGTYVLNWTGTATATVNGTTIAKGGSISLTGGSNATVRFTSGTFSLPQLERAILPTSFDYRDITSELSRCQRYYATCYAYQQTYITSAGLAGISVSLPVRMRTTPTIAILSNISGNLTTPTFSSSGTSDAQATVVIVSANGTVVGQATLSVSFSATAEL